MQVFQEALREAAEFIETGQEPAGFTMQLQQVSSAVNTPPGGKARAKDLKGISKKEGGSCASSVCYFV
jgi:hypothetical protein